MVFKYVCHRSGWLANPPWQAFIISLYWERLTTSSLYDQLIVINHSAPEQQSPSSWSITALKATLVSEIFV